MPVPRSLLLILLPLCATACAERQPAPESSVTDSAGVRMIENDAPSPQTPRITLAEAADVVIGTQAGDSLVTLHRVQDARLLGSGGIVVVNALELLWFGPTGDYRARNGGSGGGPGEFTGLSRVELLPGDTILALNTRPPSGKVFGPTGDLVRTYPLANTLASGVAGLGDGGWATIRYDPASEAAAPAVASEFREYYHVVRHAPDMTVQDTLLRLAGERLYGTGGRAVRVPLTPRAHMTARGERIAAGSGDVYELRVFDSAGTLRQIIRNSVANPPPDLPPQAEPRRPPPVAEAGGSLSGIEPPMPESAPAFDALLLANNGNIWVRRYGVSDVREWHVYNLDGQLSATALLPAGFRPTEITDTRVLGIWFDELDVETVRLYRYALAPAGQR